jgi:hypothetical protein
MVGKHGDFSHSVFPEGVVVFLEGVTTLRIGWERGGS